MSDTAAPIGSARHPRIRTTVVLSHPAWEWLKRKALDDAGRTGGKPSASDVVEQLVREEAARTK